MALQDSFVRKADKTRLVRRVARDPDLVDELFECLASNKAPVKFGAEKVLRGLAEQHPAVLYPHLPRLIEGLDSESKVLRWGALFSIAHLAAVDDGKLVDAVLDRYFEAIRGPALIAAANAAKGATVIAQAKPYLVEDVVTKLLQVERRTYETAECKRVLLGQVVESLGDLFGHLERPRRVVNFVRRQLECERPSTRKKAEKFLKEFVSA